MSAVAKKARAKAPALIVPQTAEAANELLLLYGHHANEVVRIDNRLAQASLRLKAVAEAKAKSHQDALKTIFKQLEAYGAANRTKLTDDGKSKTVSMPGGYIGWRVRPPKVTLRDKVETIVEWLKTSRFRRRFLRIKWELSKEAMLAAPALAKSVPGVTITRDVEDFFVFPAGLDLAPPPVLSPGTDAALVKEGGV